MLPLVTLGALLWLAPPAAPAFAAPTDSVAVAYADLDLSGRAGAAALDRRIGHAVRALCGTASAADLKARNAVHRCRAEARSNASEQRERAIESARRQAILASSDR
jgi:UrcA family protein